MGIRKGEAKATVLNFFNEYLVHRDLKHTLQYITGTIQWVGTGKSELVEGIEEASRILQEEFTLAPEPYCFTCKTVSEHLCSDFAAVVLLTADVARDSDVVEIRVTASCIFTEEGCRIASIHASTANDSQAENEYFPASVAGGDRHLLEQRVGAKTLDLLGKSIPGGIMGGYLEPDFPLYFINEQILSYLGFTYEEFMEATDGYVINCMHPEDRERVELSVNEAFSKDCQYEVQYRMLKKDGSYIWVSDVGKKGMSEDGRAVCISVVHDISDNMEYKRKLELDASEKERQAERYNRLFQSVLCGIVQYRLDDGEVVFENANQEAIRLFGYEPEEFWSKTDWDLPLLIDEEDRERILKEISELQKPGDKKTYEYRLLQKNGNSCWIIGSAEIILDEEGRQIVQSVFLDIDSRKKAERRNRMLTEQVEASNELLRLALEHTTTCEFYYYPQQNLCKVPERTCSYYHVEPEYRDMPESFGEARVAEEYRSQFYESYEKIHRGETANLEFRIKGENLWCRETISVVQNDENGNPTLAIGILEDITHQKEMEVQLEEARSRDSLTGLYNKETGTRLVQEYLRQKPAAECCGLMLLDMDNFESINREEGNAFADAILQEVADILKTETKEDGIQIRLGGDEFMLFIRDCNKPRAGILGPRIAEQVKRIFVQSEKEIPISVSIGMCVTDVVEEYNGLYRCAESTLKYVKEHGKGQAACYLDTSNELGVFLTQIYTEEHPVNVIDRDLPRREEDLVSFALNLLGKSRNLDDAVSLLLARIGKYFNLDRVSILEANREFLSLRFSHQWARHRADFQLGQDIYVTAEEFEEVARRYDEDGLCGGNMSSRLSTISSCLQAGIWDCGEFVGSMSFEIREPEYQWTEEQKKLLKELVKIIPSFLMKAKADAVSRAKTDFLSRMSHEIRTPMNAISGMTTIAKSVLEDREHTLDCLEKIESANNYLLNLINDILDMSRIESGKMEINCERLEMASFLKKLEAMMKTQAEEKNLRFVVENRYAANRPLYGDDLRLSQVLINIVGNAIKFTDNGGHVILRVEALGENPRVSLRFSVEDSGIGIEPAALKRIFNAFEQADRSTASRHGGTGLGLAISSRLVQMMGGVLEVKSQVGKGSLFYFTVPFDYAPEDETEIVEPEKAEPITYDFSGKRLLLAEDNELNREIAQTILQMNGFQVECAVDGSEALKLFEKKEPWYFDGILMDIRMPVMDGLEATRRIRTLGRADSRTVPIIALTANAFDEDSKKSLESGMDGHLSKPIRVEELFELLGKCLKEKEVQGGPAERMEDSR